MFLSGNLFKKLETLAESSTEIEINKMSAVQCYNKLIEGKTTDEPLSTAAKCKMIIHHVLSTFDLVVEKEHEYILKTDTVPAELTYNHIMLEFKERFTFHLVFSHLDEGFNVFLKRRRVSTGSSERARFSEPTYDIEIDSTELPSLLDDDKENDVAQLMKIMGRIILRFHKVWELYPSTQRTPGPSLEFPDIDTEHLRALCAGDASQNPTSSRI